MTNVIIAVLSLLLLLLGIINENLACFTTGQSSSGRRSNLTTTRSPSKEAEIITLATTVQPLSFGQCGHSRYVNNGEDPSLSGIVMQNNINTTQQNAVPGAANHVGIVAGVTALKDEYPWQAYLSIYNEKVGSSYICGGSLISSRWIVTAAHCCVLAANPGHVTVSLGGNNLLGDFAIKTKADGVFPHPNYNSVNQDSDICLIRIPKITFTSWTVQPLCLPSSCQSTCQQGDAAVITGWGLTNENGLLSTTLQRGLVPIVDSASCAARFPSLTDNQVCAGYPEGGTDACQGDSGGPLACLKSGTYQLDGVTSFGYGCGQANSPGVYTRLCRFIYWISTVTTINN